MYGHHKCLFHKTHFSSPDYSIGYSNSLPFWSIQVRHIYVDLVLFFWTRNHGYTIDWLWLFFCPRRVLIRYEKTADELSKIAAFYLIDNLFFGVLPSILLSHRAMAEVNIISTHCSLYLHQNKNWNKADDIISFCFFFFIETL